MPKFDSSRVKGNIFSINQNKLYGCETWQFAKNLERRLVALEMDFWTVGWTNIRHIQESSLIYFQRIQPFSMKLLKLFFFNFFVKLVI